MPSPALAQTSAVFRLEVRKTFFARRSLWVYLLALAPLLLFFGYSVQTRMESAQRQQLAAENQKPLTAADFAAIHRGMSDSEVLSRLGPPPRRITFRQRRRDNHDNIVVDQNQWYRYSDGSTDYSIVIANGAVARIRSNTAPSVNDLETTFASIFQFFFLRLAVFFGCLGIFMNLFRGELLDKSLHFYFLAPLRRSRVLAGKFLAGLAAAITIFCISVALQLFTLARLTGNALPHAASYIAITALACLGYGAVFLAAGLLFKNPVAPAAALLVWESLNPFLPALLKKFSVIYYLGQLTPVSVASGPGTSALFALLVSTPDPISPLAAILGLILVTALVLAYAIRRVRTLEIDYSSE
ncbi:MAG TPA: ABC transporter permease subunit [Terriglobales bacterium]|nr:ABC transporter permease subunit [Terriglobales bacterium]